MGQAVMQRSGAWTDQYYILLGNLPWKCRWQDLKDLVRRYSKAVEHAEVYLAPDGRSRGFGFVRVRGRDEALRVIRQLDGHEWEGRALMAKLGNEHDVCPTADPTEKRPATSTPTPNSSSPSGSRASFSQSSGQPPTCQPPAFHSPAFQPTPFQPNGEYHLWPAFQESVQYGPALAPCLPTSYHCGSAYGGSYATHFPPTNSVTPTYGLSQGYQYAPMILPGQIPQDFCPMLIDHSNNWIKPSPHTVVPMTGGLPINLSNGAVVTEPRGIHVRNLPYDISWKELRDHLQKAGTIVRCEVPKGSNGRGKGYGTVLFKTQQEADCCLDMFNGSTLKGREIWMRRDKFATRKASAD
ncbi:hypothetical protein BDD12DRAFT_875620 [Trichophaea hybrida]|nr:hypothetical protein BDD12DRAFT_875620 [Trichophaea hybrida]